MSVLRGIGNVLILAVALRKIDGQYSGSEFRSGRGRGRDFVFTFVVVDRGERNDELQFLSCQGSRNFGNVRHPNFPA